MDEKKRDAYLLKKAVARSWVVDKILMMTKEKDKVEHKEVLLDIALEMMASKLQTIDEFNEQRKTLGFP